MYLMERIHILEPTLCINTRFKYINEIPIYVIKHRKIIKFYFVKKDNIEFRYKIHTNY